MRWLRSWPDTVPAGRAYVADEMERLILRDYDYAPLADIDESVCVLEWDVAMDATERRDFAYLCEQQPNRVHVAPYHLTLDGQTVWAHRRVTVTGIERWIDSYERWADYVGFGCIYFPRDIVRAFLAAPAPARGRSPFLMPAQAYTDERFTDQTFSIWHAHHRAADRAGVLVHWCVHPQHLHG